MYTDSALFARPGELFAIARGQDLAGVTALVPGPQPRPITAAIYGPPMELRPSSPQWMRDYLVFFVPRPWTLWSLYLPDEQRPGRTGLITFVALLVGAISFGALGRQRDD